MDYRQVELVSEDTHMVCWLEDEPRIKVGAYLTLKDIPNVTWQIIRAYNKQPEHQRRTWRVGGL
jgi:hypothetical protein